MDVVKEEANVQKLTEVNRVVQMPMPVRAFDPFMPTYARGGNALRPPAKKQSAKVIVLSLSQNIKLHESENPWLPSHKVEHTPNEAAPIKKLRKRVRGILNKLTPQKFETLVAQVRDELGIDTEEKLKVVIDLIFEKAIDEPMFSVPYANMCKSLALVRVPQEGSGGQVQFRKLLLTKCQHEFEKDRHDELQKERKNAIAVTDTDQRKEWQMEFEENEKKMRMRQLGNIKFIGELFKLGMLAEPVTHECIKKLLSQGDEVSLECVALLIQTIGKELQERENKNLRELPSLMGQYLDQIQKIINRRLTSARIRFKLQDVIDLKKNNWIPRREENYPKTIDQIHEEAEREAIEVQLIYKKESYSNRQRRKFQVRKMNVSKDGRTSTSKSDEESCRMVDPSKLKSTKKHEFTDGKVIDEIMAKLTEFFSENEENENIFNWIDVNVPPSAVSDTLFIRALAQEVHKASIIETYKGKELDQLTLKKRLPLLTKFIRHNQHFELQVLYAMQQLMNDLNQPKGLLRQIFDILYDDDVISEDTFKMWEQCKDPSEQEGKGDALISVRGFFTWLREAESGEEVEDE